MDATNAYKENTVITQSPGRLIVLLYEGAIKFCHQAINALDAEDFESKGIYVNKAIDIIDELNVTLDTDVGGEVAVSLRSLYNFMIRHLYEAHTKNNSEKIREVIRLLEDLNEGWKAITD